MKSILFDLDGTLADHRHRLHLWPYFQKPVSDQERQMAWEPYHAAGHVDPTIPFTMNILQRYVADHAILIATGRPENHRLMTENWLQKHRIPYQHLLMRSTSDMRSQPNLKRHILKRYQEMGYRVQLAVDDEPLVIAMYAEEGIIALRCTSLTEDRSVASGTGRVL